MRVVMISGCQNLGSHPSPDPHEQAAFTDLQCETVTPADIDWQAAEFDRIAEQTLGGNRLA